MRAGLLTLIFVLVACGDEAPAVLVCGDGQVGEDEVCDDGNASSGDGCRADCAKVERCGDSEVDAAEVCDDGNTTSGDGCRADCAKVEQCGDGAVDANEACDDGNVASADGCRADCAKVEQCGDSVVDANEACDDGPGTACRADCTKLNTCGDTVVDDNEACDDGQGAACRADCAKLNTCGDGVLDDNEPCDDTNTASGDGCRGDCAKIELCGDGTLDAGEVCDDDNTASGDGCRGDCDKIELCGDSIADSGEPCDDGNLRGGDGCEPTCALSTCDDGIIASNEACFARALSPPPMDDPELIASGDLDGDGDGDLVIASVETQDATVYLNRGDGRFDAGLPFALGDYVGDIALADVDGDLDLDLITSGSDLAVMRNNGAGTFASGTRLALSSTGAAYLAPGDYDGDGDTDVVLHTGFSAQLAMFANNGTGTFTLGWSAPRYIYDLAAADIDADGDRDLVVRTGDVELYINNGTAAFPTVRVLELTDAFGPGTIAVGNLDADAAPEIVATGGAIELFDNNGAGQFTQSTLGTTTHSVVALADMDGDGDRDLVLKAFIDINVMRNNGSGTFAAGPLSELEFDRDVDLVFADFDGDATADLGVLDRGFPAAYTMINDGNASLVFDRFVPTSLRADDAVLVDLNGDGHLDLGAANLLGECIDILLGDGAGAFTLTRRIALDDANTQHIGAADLDGDGTVDLVTTSAYGNVLTVVRAPLAPGIRALESTTVMSAGALALGDINGDTDIDVVTASGPNAALLVNNGTGQLGAPVYLPAGSPTRLALADVDKDGDLDLATTGLPAPLTRVFQNAGNGQFSPLATLDLGEAIALADLDGDGNVDVATGTGLSLGTGAGQFSPVVAFAEIGDVQAMRAADVDADGDVDLVFVRKRTSFEDTLVILFNDGSAGFGLRKTVLSTTFSPEVPVLVGDIDGDLAPDVVTGDGIRLVIYRSRP